jgi:predicted nucleotidyltransferase
MHRTIDAKRAEITALCRKCGVRKLEVFGSAALGDDFDPERSDADFLVEFASNEKSGPLSFFAFKEELRQVLGRAVDLVECEALERSRNYIRRRHILKEAQPLYVA